jgi:CO/xanthine dehydrogenase FAD-binding subunit
MKAAAFDYLRAESLDHALEVLAQAGPDAKAIAGGQSLVPMMAMRLAQPSVLLDINRLEALKGVSYAPRLATMGATQRQRDVEDDISLHTKLPLVRAALHWVGHVQTRNRGTVGGSLVHADPSAELPLAAVVLDAALTLHSRDEGERVVPAHEFFLGPMFTATGETELLVRIDWPVWDGKVSTAFEETAMRHGDFAMASAACQLELDGDGICRRAAIGLGGMDGVPRAFPDLAAQLVGRRIDTKLADEIAHAAVALTEPGSDLHANADYRRHLGRVLMKRVLAQATGHPSFGACA